MMRAYAIFYLCCDEWRGMRGYFYGVIHVSIKCQCHSKIKRKKNSSLFDAVALKIKEAIQQYYK